MADALVLAGALMRGPFAAGVLSVLSEPSVGVRHGLDIRRIVAASSGAISAAYYAAAVHEGREAGAGARLAKLWIEQASFAGSISLSARALLARRGISSSQRVVALLRENVRPAPARRPIDLRIVATNLDGQRSFVAGGRATVHEHVFAFDGVDFASAARLERMFDVVAASAALPGVFDAVTLGGGRHAARFVDGGATNNAPLRYAIEDAPQIRRVFVISPTPRQQASAGPLRGLAYAFQLAEVLVDERLVRDLGEAEQVNEALAALREAVSDPDLRARALRALGWSTRREIEVVEIRPEEPLEGNALSGWFSRRLRADYVIAGRRAAHRALGRLEPTERAPTGARRHHDTT